MKGAIEMGKPIRARFSNGMIEPLEKVEIREGEIIKISILETRRKAMKKNFSEALKRTAGGWKDLIDCEELKRNIYSDRLIATRSEVRL
jgi:predicted DNA-binding antitoxin AbrB/MazE fold protein